MHIKLTRRLLIAFLLLSIVAATIGMGCDGEVGQPSAMPSPGQLSSTLVPNVPLDMYVYARQDSPTMIPAKMADAPGDIAVESLAIWGVPPENSFAIGMGLTLTSSGDASRIYEEIRLEDGGWKKLSDNIIYLVQGSGTAAEALKTAISNNDFKYYDDSEPLEAVAALPGGGTTMPAAVAIAKPSEALIGFIARDASPESLGQINMILKLVKLKLVAAGLYSPQQIDIAKMAETMENGGNISNLNMGMMVLVKSGYPGLLVEPAVGKLLTERGFAETNIGGVTVYKGSQEIGGEAIPVLVRIEGNRIFAAVSGQDSYAETLITGINK
ncbi:hypothetical protein ACFLX4_02395 [Chloroflexota bacterium]